MIRGAGQFFGASDTRQSEAGATLTLTTYPADQRQPWHEHEHTNFCCLLRGAFWDESAQLAQAFPEPLTLVIHPAGVRHRCGDGPQGRTCMNIEVSDSWLEHYGTSVASLGSHRVVNSDRAGIALIRLALDGLGDDVLAELVLAGDAQEESTGWWSRLDTLIDEDLERHWSLATLARELAVHPVYLARTFRARRGTSVTQALHRSRLVRAARETLRDPSSLGQVALNSGFADQAHFSRLFKREFGVCPSVLKPRN